MLSVQLIPEILNDSSSFDAHMQNMALRFGNTTRLHHIDFPSASAESGTKTSEQEAIPKNAVTQPGVKKVAGEGSHQKTGKVNVRIRKRQEKEITRKARPDKNVQSLSGSTQVKTETVNTGESCGLQDGPPNRSSSLNAVNQHAAMCYMNLTVEWDVLDSFSEFATFLEIQNPICPAHLIDTPEKLLSVLYCEL